MKIHLLIIYMFLALLSACLSPKNSSQIIEGQNGCGKDTDCKGERICVQRVCQDPIVSSSVKPPDNKQVQTEKTKPDKVSNSKNPPKKTKPSKKTTEKDSRFSENVETLLLEKMNDFRKLQGRPALKSKINLQKVARDHSEEMARLGYFSHNSPTPGRHTFIDRIEKEKLQGFSTAGENIIFRQGKLSDEELADALLAQWLDSPPHRANILDPAYGMTGLGIYREGELAWGTQVFVDRIK